MSAHLQSFLVVALGLFALGAAVPTQPAEQYRFTYNGVPASPWIVSLAGTPQSPAPGDVAQFRGFHFTLDEQRILQLSEQDGQLYCDDGNGKRLLVARIHNTYKDDKRVLVNPFNDLKAEQIRQLRGIRVEYWDAAVAAQLAQIDRERTCVTVTHRAAQNKRLPPLPERVRYLVIEVTSSDTIDDWSSLARYQDLRLLTVDGSLSEAPLDLATLWNNRELRYLDLSISEVRDANALARLTGLRELHLVQQQWLKDVRFARQLPELRRLVISGTPVEDLAPLASHPALIVVDANSSAVRVLPAEPMPRLRLLNIMSSPVSDPNAARFSKTNPQCELQHRWQALLDKQLASATRLRVRSGGTCHRDPTREKLLAELDDPRKIRELLAMFRVDEDNSNFHCMCCGSPTFEWYHGDELLGMIGFHHGQSLRWPGGWPGDAALTAASADALVAWLADHGVKGPAQEREEAKRRAAAAQRRAERYTALIPANLREALSQERSLLSPATQPTDDPAAKAMAQSIPDAAARATLCLRLYGCHTGSFNRYDQLEYLLKQVLLPAQSAAAILAAVRAAGDDADTLRGGARWLLAEDGWRQLEARELEQVLPVLGKAGLSHPRPASRRDVMRAMGEIKTPAAMVLLRSVLAGQITPAALAADDQDEPGGVAVFRGNTKLDADADSTCAAQILAELGDRDSVNRIQGLITRASQRDAAILKEAAAKLQRP